MGIPQLSVDCKPRRGIAPRVLFEVRESRVKPGEATFKELGENSWLMMTSGCIHLPISEHNCTCVSSGSSSGNRTAGYFMVFPMTFVDRLCFV